MLYDFARQIEEAQRAMREVGRHINAHIRELHLINDKLPAVGARIHMRAVVSNERAKAQQHLSAEVYRVRSELGLPTHPFQPDGLGTDRCADATMLDGYEWCKKSKAVHP